MSVRSLRGAAAAGALTAALLLAVPAVAVASWTTVVNDRFDSGGVPGHWMVYDGPYGSGPGNCASPSHVFVAGGSLHLLMRYETSGACGAGWYTGGLQVARADASVDQRVVLRWRIASSGVVGHHVIPMRFPDSGAWPASGEEDYCEGAGLLGCTTFLHYGLIAPGDQLMHSYSLSVDLSRWHVMRFQRRNHVVTAWIDDMTTPAWRYVGTAETLPDTLKRVVLQQECRSTGCPAGTTGTEDIRIDWIRIRNPA